MGDSVGVPGDRVQVLLVRPEVGADTPFWVEDGTGGGPHWDDLEALGLPAPLQWHLIWWCWDASAGDHEESAVPANEGLRLLEQVRYYAGDRFEFRWDWVAPVGNPYLGLGRGTRPRPPY